MEKKALEIIFISYPRGDIYFLLIHTMKSLFDLFVFFPPTKLPPIAMIAKSPDMLQVLTRILATINWSYQGHEGRCYGVSYPNPTLSPQHFHQPTRDFAIYPSLGMTGKPVYN